MKAHHLQRVDAAMPDVNLRRECSDTNEDCLAAGGTLFISLTGHDVGSATTAHRDRVLIESSSGKLDLLGKIEASIV